MSSSGLQSLLAFLKNRYKGVLVVSVGVITFSLVLSFRNAKRIKKIEKSVRELTEKSMSKEELEFECQKLRQRTVANQTYTVVSSMSVCVPQVVILSRDPVTQNSNPPT